MIDLSKEISKALQDYTHEVEEGLKEAQKDVTSESVKDLKSGSPRKTGKYAKGWRAKKTNRGYIVHNATKPQLTHLLENGHVKRNGGRVPAHKHIAPVEQKAINEFEKLVEKVIRG